MALDDAKLAQLGALLADRLQDMQQDFQIEGQPGFSINSGYRSPERQAQLFNAAVAKYGSPDAARKWVAPPGHSMHNSGLAADLAFAPGAMSTVHALAPQYGLKFPMPYENWHIEPVETRGGTPGATALAYAPAGGTPSDVTGSIGSTPDPASTATDTATPAVPIAPATKDDKTEKAYLALLGTMAPKTSQQPQFSRVNIQGPTPEQANGLSKLVEALKRRMMI